MTTSLRFVSADLNAFPDDGRRYEIIDGELYVSKQPHWHHQRVCLALGSRLHEWSRRTGKGQAALAPGLIFADDDDVAPDLAWISSERLPKTLASDGKLHAAPELVVEVLSAGVSNEKRDREAKLKLYSRRGVNEYWIVDWRARCVEIYRRTSGDLALSETVQESGIVASPSLLEGFQCLAAELFEGVPR